MLTSYETKDLDTNSQNVRNVFKPMTFKDKKSPN